MKTMKEKHIKKVYVMPFMLVAGDHAKNDMAGDDEDSWKMQLLRAGFEPEIILKGLGESRILWKFIVKRPQKICCR